MKFESSFLIKNGNVDDNRGVVIVIKWNKDFYYGRVDEGKSLFFNC